MGTGSTAEGSKLPIDSIIQQLAAIPVPFDSERRDPIIDQYLRQQELEILNRRDSTGTFSDRDHHRSQPQNFERHREFENARHSLQHVSNQHKLQLLEVDQTQIRADTETDSSGKSVGSMTVLSTVYDYKYENGRRYHNFRAGKYYLPNDESEQKRLDKLHHFFLLTYGGQLHLAPLKDPRKVLDLGTGTGIWAIEFGDEYPAAEITGIDLSPIQPQWLPENVKFEVDDFEDEWLREHNSFDYIHSRTIVGCVKDWPRLFGQVFDHLAPGGYFELQETDLTGGRSDDGTFKPGSKFSVYQDNLRLAGNKAGVRMDVAPNLTQYMIDAGFVEVREHRVKIPVGTWPKDKKLKEIGAWAHEIVSEGLEAYCMAFFTRVLGMDKKTAKSICIGAKEDLDDKKIHMYFFNHFVYGRKPTTPVNVNINAAHQNYFS